MHKPPAESVIPRVHHAPVDANRKKLLDTVARQHNEAAALIGRLGRKAMDIASAANRDPKTNWGYSGDLEHMIEMLKRALGEE